MSLSGPFVYSSVKRPRSPSHLRGASAYMQRSRSVSSLPAAPARPCGATELPGRHAVSHAHLEQGTVCQGVTVLLRGPWAAQTLRGGVCYRGGPESGGLSPVKGREGSWDLEWPRTLMHIWPGESLWIVVACEVSLSPDLIHVNKRFLIPAMRQDLCWELRYGSSQTNADPALARRGSGAS